MPNTVLYWIDLKNADKRSASLVFAIIKAYGLENHVVWGGSQSDTHAYLLELGPEIARYYPYMSVVKTFIWHLLGCLFCCPLENDIFMPPIMTSEQV